MKILAIADEECASLWDFFDKSKIKDIDLIISCGDLDPRYLSFLVTMTTVPVLYVHGNHDGKYEYTYLYMKGFGFLGLEVPCGIRKGLINIRKKKRRRE